MPLPSATVPDDIVLAIMTTEKRHGLIEMLRETWLRDAKALLLTDAPGLAETPRQKVRIWRGHPNCGAADRGGPTIAIANETFWPEGYKWIIHVDDDVLVNVPNLARFLSAYNADIPLWFSAHGCDASYVSAARSDPPCVAQHAPRGCIGCHGRRDGLRNGLRRACEAAGSAFSTRDAEYGPSALATALATADGRHAAKVGQGWRGGCGAYPDQQGLKTFGAEVGQSYCGGTGCVFSRGYLASFPYSEIFRNKTSCQGCTRGQQDVALSRCLFHHNPAAVAPIGIPGFFWGRPGERLVEQWLTHYPDCLKSVGPGGPSRELGGCVRRHGLMEWFTMHLQVRGAFTTLYRNLTPAVWASTFRNGKNAVPVPELLQRTHAVAVSAEPHAQAQRAAWASRLCCGLLRRDIVQCNLGCTPWRMLSRYANSSNGRRSELALALPCGTDDGTDPAHWEQPAPRGTETALLHPHRSQTWANGAMKCDFCEGFFNGWRGF